MTILTWHTYFSKSQVHKFCKCYFGAYAVNIPSRNLHIREDTAKYLLNLDVNSAYYDPKTRSMREDPLPDMDPNEKFYVVSMA